MKRNPKFALALAAVVMAASPVWAQTGNSRIYRDGSSWVEEITGTMAAPASLRVATDTGSIQVQGGAQNDVSYTIRKRVRGSSEEAARRELAGFHVNAVRRGDAAVIEGATERHHTRLSVEYQIQAPRDLRHVDAETEGGNLSLHALSGSVVAQSGGGNISLGDLSGEVKVDTGGGNIAVDNSTNLLNLRTGGGNIRITGSKGRVNASTGGGNINLGGASQAVTLSTGGGSVQVQQCGAELNVSTGGGSISVGDVNGGAKLQTGGGNIRLTSARGPVVANSGGGSIELWKLSQSAWAETGAGPITAEFVGINADSTLQTSTGDIIVYINPQARMTIRARLDVADGFQIRSDFPEVKITSRGGGYGPKNYYAEGSLNGGGPVLYVRTISSNIEFRRAR